MKTTLIIYGVLIFGLFVWVFIQSRTINELDKKIIALTPAPPVKPAGDVKPEGQATGGDWVEQLQKKLKNVDIEFTT